MDYNIGREKCLFAMLVERYTLGIAFYLAGFCEMDGSMMAALDMAAVLAGCYPLCG